MSDLREAFVILRRYGWGTPWHRSEGTGNREGVGLPAIASRQARQAGFTRP
jgi:hypothetical protein